MRQSVNLFSFVILIFLASGHAANCSVKSIEIEGEKAEHLMDALQAAGALPSSIPGRHSIGISALECNMGTDLNHSIASCNFEQLFSSETTYLGSLRKIEAQDEKARLLFQALDEAGVEGGSSKKVPFIFCHHPVLSPEYPLSVTCQLTID